eukprot:bmy_14557T0
MVAGTAGTQRRAAVTSESAPDRPPLTCLRVELLSPSGRHSFIALGFLSNVQNRRLRVNLGEIFLDPTGEDVQEEKDTHVAHRLGERKAPYGATSEPASSPGHRPSALRLPPPTAAHSPSLIG